MISYRKFFQDHESVLRSFEKIAFFFLEIKRLYLVQKIYLFKIFSSLRIRALFLDSIKETETYYLRGTLISIKKTRNVNTWLDIHWLNLTWHDCTWFDIMWLDKTCFRHYYCLMFSFTFQTIHLREVFHLSWKSFPFHTFCSPYFSCRVSSKGECTDWYSGKVDSGRVADELPHVYVQNDRLLLQLGD